MAEYENDIDPFINRTITSYPVRVIFKDNGLIEKIQYDNRESNSSYHLKTGIIRTMQLDWAQIQKAVNANGPKEFVTLLAGREGTCNVKTDVKIDSSDDFCVNLERQIRDCAPLPDYNKYEKFPDSTKKWHFHFDNGHAANFHHAKIEIEDFFAPDATINIKTGFKFEECVPFREELDASALTDVVRLFQIPKKEGKKEEA